MSLKGTQTEKNLLTAFCGESQARNKYTYFASAAKINSVSEIPPRGAHIPLYLAVVISGLQVNSRWLIPRHRIIQIIAPPHRHNHGVFQIVSSL